MSRERAQVVGAGGHGSVVVATLLDAGFDVVAIWDDAPDRAGTACLGVPVRGTVAEMREAPSLPVVLAIGDNRTRERFASSLDVSWLSPVVHPHAYVHPSVHLGAGTVVFAGAIVQPNVRVDDHVIVNTSASIDHDCQIGSFAHIGPGARLCGRVMVGSGALVGVGACARPAIHIGEWSTAGAGAVLVAPVAARSVVAGNPARQVKRE